MASSSSTGATAADFDFGGGAAFFLEKRATVLHVAGLDAVEAAVLVAPLKLRGFPSISDTPREAAAVDAAREAISLCCKVFLESFASQELLFWLTNVIMDDRLIEKGDTINLSWWMWTCHVGFIFMVVIGWFERCVI